MIDIDENLEEVNMIKSFEDGILKLAKSYRNIVVLNSDSTKEVGAIKFADFFRERYFNFGLAEANMASCAVGFSVRGKIPFITGMSSFLVGKAWEQIRNGICYPNLNVKIVGVGGGLYAGQNSVGCQSLEDISLMRSLPNMKVVCPADANETESVLEEMMIDYGPTYLRLHSGNVRNVVASNERFEFGKSAVLRDGTDICIFTMGAMVGVCMDVAESFENEGVSVKVVNISSIKPIDEEAIVNSCHGMKMCFTVEDHNIVGGLGSAVSEVLAEKSNVVLQRIGVKDVFGESGKPEDLYKKYGLDEEGILEQIRGFIDES